MTTAVMGRAEKSARIDIRLTDLQRSRYEKAATLKGQTMTQWASMHLDACASRDIAEATTTMLSDEAFNLFCDILNKPMPEAAVELLNREPIWK